MAGRASLLALLFLCFTRATPPLVDVVDYSMALCPCSAQFAQDFNHTVLSDPALAAIINFKQPFVGNWSLSSSSSSEPPSTNVGETTCFHGKEECIFQQWLLCAQNISEPLSRAGFEFQLCTDACSFSPKGTLEKCPSQYQNPHNLTLLQDCAADAGLPFDPLQKCATGLLGEQLMAESAKRSNAAGIEYGIQGLPTVTIDGKVVTTFFECSIGLSKVVDLICKAYTGSPKPAACSSAVRSVSD